MREDRECTCHPDEAPVPCRKKYAFTECENERLREENEQLMEQLALRSEIAMAKDMQEIMRINETLREENARLREELQKGFTAMRVFAKYRELEAEIETLRKAVKAAYYEGWQDNASIDDTEDRLHAEWEYSEACAAIAKARGEKEENVR